MMSCLGSFGAEPARRARWSDSAFNSDAQGEPIGFLGRLGSWVALRATDPVVPAEAPGAGPIWARPAGVSWRFRDAESPRKGHRGAMGKCAEDGPGVTGGEAFSGV